MSSDQNDENPNYIYLRPDEVDSFRENAERDLSRIKSFFSDYFKGIINFGDEVFSLFCELYATNITLKDYLDRTFVVPPDATSPEKLAFKVNRQHVVVLGKTLLIIKDIKNQLSQNGLTIESQ
mgnify:CR=1 FL=1|jgi:hypothetical protein|tara:strand:+ start:143 stop:511 length:369 start_codon:yes stop_codon:yes gene_type:complete